MSDSSDTKKRRRSSQKSPRTRKVARSFHRWLGLVATLPLLWLALSGFALNHADRLGLNDQQITNSWVLSHYHQLPDGTPLGVKVGERRVEEWGQLIFLDHKLLEIPGELVGALPMGGNLVVATHERLAVIDGAGEIVVEHDELSLPELPLEKIAFDEDGFKARSGGRWWIFSEDLLSFKRSVGAPAPGFLSKTSPLSDEEKEALGKTLQSSHAMPAARVLLDAHSGKLFGKIGVMINDLAVLSIIILTILGLRLFPRRRDGGRKTVIDQPISQSGEAGSSNPSTLRDALRAQEYEEGES